MNTTKLETIIAFAMCAAGILISVCAVIYCINHSYLFN